MKIFTKLIILILLTCIATHWANAQANCGATVPELPTESTITIDISNPVLTFNSLITVSNLPDLEYAIQLVGLPATDSLGDRIIAFSRANTINIDELGFSEGDQFRVTPIAYDLPQIQGVIGSIFEGTFFLAPCCAIAGISLPDLCENLEQAGVSQGSDITGLNDIITLTRVFNNDPDLTYSVIGFAAAVDDINETASALPGPCGGDELPICYAASLEETGAQLYDIIESLSIELTAFEAYAEQKHNLLKWTTATEENNAYFSIQRSADGQDFIEIGRVNGSGTTTDAANYEFIDSQPLSPFNYYRLQQVDFDGKSSFSDIVGLVRKDTESLDVISFGPNPNNGEMEVIILDQQSSNIDYAITDINGRTLIQNRLATIQGFNTFDVNITDFASGIYFISIVKGELSTHLKFLKR